MNSPDSPLPSANLPQTKSDPSGAPEKQTDPESAVGTAEPQAESSSVFTAELKVGGTLAGYRLVKKLGEGGMGLVFAAEDIRLKRRVALKVMKPEVAAKEQHRHRFLREAQAAAAVEHDHIVPIFQIGEDNGIPFIAMPFLKGEALDARLRRSRLTVPEILTIARQASEGLAAAHAHGLIHRDIKPGNIWLESTDTGADRVKILDFGLARLSGADSQHLTHSGAIMGTPAYMAPEQARGWAVDHRADLFSLGCIFYEMTTGKRPFTGPDTMAVLTSLAIDTPVEPIALNRAISPQLSQLIMALLEKDPAKRPQSARVVVDVLKKLQPETTVVVVASAAPVEEANPWADLDALSQTDVPAAEPESSIMASLPEGPVEAARSSSRKHEPEKSSVRRSGASSRSLKRMDAQPISARTKWLIAGVIVGLLMLAVVAFIIIRNKFGNEGAGKTTPIQGNNNAGQPPKGNPNAGGGENYALEFDGKTSCVEVSSLIFWGGPCTIEATVTPAAIEGANGLIVALVRAGSVVIEQSGDSWTGTVESTDGPRSIQSAPGTARAGQRVHLAIVWNGTEPALFVDGKKFSYAAGKKASGLTVPGMFIGRFQPQGATLDRLFAGIIDEIRISKIVRYDKDFTPQRRLESDRNTEAFYHCDEGQGEVLRDSSGRNHHGKIIAAKWVKADETPGTPAVGMPND